MKTSREQSINIFVVYNARTDGPIVCFLLGEFYVCFLEMSVLCLFLGNPLGTLKSAIGDNRKIIVMI